MFSLLGGIAAVVSTTALSAFSEGLVTSIIAYAAVKSTAKANITLKK